jgi:hypothetical protein
MAKKKVVKECLLREGQLCYPNCGECDHGHQDRGERAPINKIPNWLKKHAPEVIQTINVRRRRYRFVQN